MTIENFDLYLEKYARLIVETGINVQKGHTVVVQISVDRSCLQTNCFCKTRWGCS